MRLRYEDYFSPAEQTFVSWMARNKRSLLTASQSDSDRGFIRSSDDHLSDARDLFLETKDGAERHLPGRSIDAEDISVARRPRLDSAYQVAENAIGDNDMTARLTAVPMLFGGLPDEHRGDAGRAPPPTVGEPRPTREGEHSDCRRLLSLIASLRGARGSWITERRRELAKLEQWRATYMSNYEHLQKLEARLRDAELELATLEGTPYRVPRPGTKPGRERVSTEMRSA